MNRFQRSNEDEAVFYLSKSLWNNKNYREAIEESVKIVKDFITPEDIQKYYKQTFKHTFWSKAEEESLSINDADGTCKRFSESSNLSCRK